MILPSVLLLVALSAAPVTLKIEKRVPVAQQGFVAYESPAKCGADGSVYLRFFTGASRLALGPVVRISSDGKRVVALVPETINGAPLLHIVDFAPAGDGGAYLLAGTTAEAGRAAQHYLLTFDSDGKLVRRSQLDSRFHIFRVAALGANNLLAIGMEMTQMKPVAALFNRDGGWIKDIELPADVRLENEVPCSQCKAPGSQREEEFFEQVSRSRAGSFDAGAYLYRAQPEGPLYLVGEGGQVRRVALTPPPDSELMDVKLGGGRILATYKLPQSTAEHLVVGFVLTDAESGAPLGEYTGSDGALAGIACYDGQRLSYISLEDGKLQLVYASPDR